MMRFNAAFLSDRETIITEKALYPIKMCGEQKVSEIFGVKKAIKKNKMPDASGSFFTRSRTSKNQARGSAGCTL